MINTKYTTYKQAIVIPCHLLTFKVLNENKNITTALINITTTSNNDDHTTVAG